MTFNYIPGGGIGDRRQTKYCVVVYLPKHLDTLLSPLREKYDPNYNLIGSHLTIVYPFSTPMPLDELTGIIKSEVDQRKSLTVELDSVGDFYPDAPFIYWRVVLSNELNEFYYRLHSRMDLPLIFKNWVPHVTVASEISSHRVVHVKDAIASYIRPERFEAAAIDLITPLPGDRWVSVRTFPLPGNQTLLSD